jgi:COP9 signalosome complex subunit 6
MEVAFQAKLKAGSEGQVTLDDDWFSKRLEDCELAWIYLMDEVFVFKMATKLICGTDKDVHKQPQLDLVGWFTLGPATGPGPHILPIHSRISELYNESPILLLFHPEDTFTEATAAGKLPLTLYESLTENAPSDPNDKAMEIDGAAQAKSTKFRELVYSVETGEAEMISVDFVARGGGNATAVEGSTASAAAESQSPKTDEAAGKRSTRAGKQKEEKDKDALIDESTVLSGDDEESKLNTRTV